MQIGLVAKKVGLSVDAIRFYERNARCCPDLPGRGEAFAVTAKMMSKHWPSSGAYKVWDSSLVKFEDF
jgi:hypothetical protein